MVPDLHDLAVTEAEDIDDRDLLAAAQQPEPERGRIESPLPARRDEISFRNLEVDAAAHVPLRVEKVSDLFLPNGSFGHVLLITDVVDDVLVGDVTVKAVRTGGEPEILVKGAGPCFVTFLQRVGYGSGASGLASSRSEGV